MIPSLHCLCLALLLLPAHGFIQHPINHFFLTERPRKEHVAGSNGDILLFESRVVENHIHIRRGGTKQSSKRKSKKSENNSNSNNNVREAIIRNRKITELGARGRWNDILKLAEAEKDRFDNVNWSTTFHQLGKMKNPNNNYRRDPRFASFVNQYSCRIHEHGLEWAGIRQVANVVHTIGKMQLRSPATARILEFVVSNRRQIVRGGSAQNVANICWSLAKLRRSRGDRVVVAPLLFLREVERRAQWLVTDGNTQVVANTAWAFATLNVKSPKLFAEIERRADWLVKEGNTRCIANTAWAYATLGEQSSPRLFAEIEKHANWLLKDGSTTQADASIVWASVSRFQYHSPQLLKNANDHGAWLVSEGNTQDISNLALAFANGGYHADIFFTAVANNVPKLIQDGNPQVIINVCHAFTILNLGKIHTDAFHRLWTTAVNLNPEILTSKALRQLAQVFAYAKADGIQLQQPSATLTTKIQTAGQSSIPSKHLKEVLQVLEEHMGVLDCQKQVHPLPEGSKLNNGMICIDLACKSHQIAIEYDGMSHFLRELGTGRISRRETGATKAKRRFLQQSGWTVINIDYRDWMEASNEKDGQLLFLHEKLHSAGIRLKKYNIKM